MSDTNPTFILAAVIFLVLLAVGIFVVTLIYLQRGQPKKKSRPILGGAGSRPQPQPATLSPELAASSPVDAPARSGEVMRVVRDQQTGRIFVEVSGQRYAHIREIKDAQVGRRVLWAIADLLRFTGGMAASPQAVRSVSASTSTPQPTPPFARQPTPAKATSGYRPELSVGQPVVPTADLAASRAHDRETSPVGEQLPRQTNISRTITTFFRRGLQPPPAVQPIGSFIDEIDQVLQKYIQNRPVPLPYEVHVKAGEDGSLQIKVGANTYRSPDDVPDPEIRELIKSAVSEWQSR